MGALDEAKTPAGTKLQFDYAYTQTRLDLIVKTAAGQYGRLPQKLGFMRR